MYQSLDCTLDCFRPVKHKPAIQKEILTQIMLNTKADLAAPQRLKDNLRRLSQKIQPRRNGEHQMLYRRGGSSLEHRPKILIAISQGAH
jgi:hypothetical protein